MIRLAVGIGLRSMAARSARGRAVTGAVIGALASGCLLVAVAVGLVRSHELERFERLRAAAEVRPARGTVLAAAQYRGRQVQLLLVASNVRGEPSGHGIARLAAGEVRFSPALADRVARDPRLARWFPYRQGPNLPRAAVATAGEYAAYIGVDAARYPGFLSGPSTGPSHAGPGPAHYAALGSVLFLVAPAAGLLVLAGRFGRRERRERFGALRLLGFPATAARVVDAVELGVPVAAGALLTAVVAPVVSPDHLVLPIVGRWVFGADARPPAAGLVAVVVLCALGAAAAACSTGTNRWMTGRVRALVASADRAPTVGPLLYTAGAAATVAAAVSPKPRDPLRIVSILLICIALPGTITLASGVAARLIAAWPGGVPRFLAMRRLAADPRSLARAGGLVGIVVFAIGASQPLAQLVATPDISWVRRAAADGQSSVLARSEHAFPAPLVLRDLRPAGVRTAVPAVGLWPAGASAASHPAASALVASCDQVRRLLGDAVRGCTGRPQVIRVADDASTVPRAGEVRTRAGRLLAQVSVPAGPPIDVAVPNVALPGLLLPPAAVPTDQAYVDDVYLRVDANVDAFTDAQAWITGSSPLHRLVNEYSGYPSGDQTGSWLLLGLTAMALIALVGVILVGADDRRDVRDWETLRALGMSAGDLLRLRGWTSGVVAAASVILGLSPAVMLSISYARLVGEPLPATRPFVSAALVAAGVVVSTSLAGALLKLNNTERRRSP